jgi:hypothetical protein
MRKDFVNPHLSNMVGHLRVSVKFALKAHRVQTWRSRPVQHCANPETTSTRSGESRPSDRATLSASTVAEIEEMVDRRLRAKLGASRDESPIRTVRGVGYLFVP